MSSTMALPKYEVKGEPLAGEIFQLRNDELGRDAVKLMNERFKGNSKVVLDISEFKGNQPVGHSNTYRRFALGPIVRELYGNNVQLISPIVSEIALKNGKLPDATSTYEDLGVVVYSLNGSNQQLAKHLVEQAKNAGLEVKFPMVFYGLKTVNDDKFPDRVSLDLSDIALAYHVPILSKDASNFKSDDSSLVENGFPSKVGQGDRILYTAKDGLRRLCRDWDLMLDAIGGNLPNSIEAGRVSFLKGEAPQNLEDALKGIEAEKRRQTEAVQLRYGKALEIMGKQ